MPVSFTASTPTEWMDISTVTRILGCTPQRVLELVQDGVLNARVVSGEPHISSASLDQYTARRPLFGKPKPRTFVKVNGRVYEEF